MAAETKTIGVLGGMGPAATVEFMKRIVQKTPARDDADHLRMLVDNNPKVPSRIKAIIEKTGADPLPDLLQMARGLEAGGADFLVMPCNTAHHYQAEVAAAVEIPFLSITAETVRYLLNHRPEARRIGFLASPAVRAASVYDKAFNEAGLIIVYPGEDGDAELLQVIRDVKKGQSETGQTEAYHRVAGELATRADIGLVACTELSVLPLPEFVDFPVLDTLDLLAEAAIVEARTG